MSDYVMFKQDIKELEVGIVMRIRMKRVSGILCLLLLIQWVIPLFTPFIGLSESVQAQTSEDIKVNFQPYSTEIPDGYIPDYGELYGTRNGYIYGWNMDHTDMSVTRDIYQDSPVDSFIKFHEGGVWEIELSEGSYDVTVSVGDDVYGSVNTINVEGMNYWNLYSLDPGEFLQETKTINVSDGKLTIDQGNALEGQTRINYVVISALTPPVISGSGVGLKGEYYNGTDFADLKLSRIDQTIDFNWGAGSPSGDLDVDAFSVRWSGKIEPRYSEMYTFYTETHGGVRLWVDNQLLIDDWDANGMTILSGTIPLTVGEKYDIKLEYREVNGEALAKLLWSSNSQSKEIVPVSQLYPPFIPDVPTNIKVYSTSTSITLTWDEVPGAAGYDVEAEGAIIDNGTNTTFIHNNLDSSSQYAYRIRSKIPEVASDWSQPVSAITKIGIPTNVNALVSGNTITVTWDEVFGATNYEIEVDGTIIDNGTNTVYVHNELMPNTQHTYRVRANDAKGAGDWSQLIQKTVLSDIPFITDVTVTSTSITITWDDVPEAVGYDMEVDGVIIDNGSNTIFAHEGLEPNTQHTYRIRARLANGTTGEWSTLIIKSTLPASGSGTGLKGDYFDNEDLTDLKTTRVDSSVNFDWNNQSPASGIEDDAFSIRWTGQIEPLFSELYTFSTEAHGGVRLWINDQLLIDDWDAHYMSEQSGTINLEAGNRYDIKLEYRETNGVALVKLFWESESQPKEIVPQSQLYPVGIPKNIVSTSTENTITLMWDPVSFADSYDVEADGVIVENVPGTIFTHNDLTPGTLHTYRIRANSGTVQGEWSQVVTETTKLGKPVIVSLDPTETTIIVSWDPVPGATGYDIEVDGTIINNGDNTTFAHNDLLSGTKHRYRVRAKSSVVTGQWSTLEEKWTLPDIPQNIRLTSTSDMVAVEWDEVRGATGYDIEVYNTIVDNGSSTSYTEEGVNPNTQRTYRVRAKNSSGAGKWSQIVAISTLPGIPTNLVAEATDTTISVSWDPVSGATSYDLEVDGTLVENILDSAYEHTDLLPNTEHSYRVKAKNEQGTSNWSETIYVTTLPSTPANIILTVKSTEIVVSWNSVSGATGYEIEVDGVVKDIGDSTNYVHVELMPNSEHTYRVRALNGSIKSFWSERVTGLTLPGIPTNLQGDATSSSITLTWDIVQGATSYEIEADGEIFDNGPNTVFSHTGLVPNTEHKYRVRARNASGPGEWSEYITISTIFGTSIELKATATSTSITLTWNSVDGATGYDVFVDGEIIDNGANTTFIHSGLEPFTWHVYRVRAKGPDFVGEWSEAITVATLLGTPTNLKAEASSTEIKVTWDEVNGATSYDIEVDGVVIDNGPEVAYIHGDLLLNTEHTYRVRARNEFVVSEWSELITQVTAPNIPVITHAEATTTSITIFWNEVLEAASYDVEVDGKVIEGIQGTSYTYDGLEPNTRHIFRVRAENEGVVSEWSDKYEQNTVPELIVNVGKDNMFNFAIVAPEKPGVTTRKIVVTYDPEHVEVLDLSAITQEVDLKTGNIEGTNITILSFVPGEIVFEIQSEGKTAVNTIKFMAKTNEYSKITYVIE